MYWVGIISRKHTWCWPKKEFTYNFANKLVKLLESLGIKPIDQQQYEIQCFICKHYLLARHQVELLPDLFVSPENYTNC